MNNILCLPHIGKVLLGFFFLFVCLFCDGLLIGLDNPFLSQNEYMHTFELLALELLIH